MSLTDDWRAGKLKDGDYYVRLTNDDTIIEHLCKGEWCFDYGWRDVIIEVLAPVPDYDELQSLRQDASSAKNMADIAKMLSQQLAEHKETCCCFENEKLLLDNQKLRQLLKKCLISLETYAAEDETCGLEEENKLAKNILPKIREVLGSEIQAPQVDDTKIQESEALK